MKTNKTSIKVAITTIAAVAILISIIYVAYLSNKGFEKIVVSQTQQELLTIAKAIATSMEEFFMGHSEALTVISNNPLFQKDVYEKKRCDRSETTFCPIKNHYEAYKKDVDAITLLDANGIMLHREPFIENRIGMDFTDKPGVAYVLREHKPHISEVFYNNLGNLAVSILEPIFYKDEFAGIVRWMIETDTISRRFVEPVKIGKNGFVWMFDNKNIVISHPKKDFTGMSVLDLVRKMHKKKDLVFDESQIQEHIKEKHDYINRVKIEKEGAGVFIGCDTNENYIVAYKKVQQGNAGLNLILMLPYSEIIGPINKHAREIFGLAGFVIMLLGAGGLVLFKSQKKRARLETEAIYLKQISDGAEALRESEERFRTMAGTANDAIIVIDNEGNVSYWNSAAQEIFGYVEQDVIGKDLHKLLISEKYYESYIKGFGKFRKTGQGAAVDKTLELSAIRKDGTEFPVELSMSAIIIKDKWHALGIIRDISQRKKMEEELRRLSNSDGLTGVANRRYFDEFLEKEWLRNMRDNKPISLIMGDIDFFKNYNDRYGHQAGDDCLKQVSAILNNMAKRPGDLAARYGGEEFAVILSGTDLKHAGVLAENANKKLKKTRIPHSDSQVADYVTLSLGVASIIPKYGTKSYDLIKAADKSLYKAKNSGRNQVVLQQ